MEHSETPAAVTKSRVTYDTEAEIDEVILRLDLTLLRPDDDELSPLGSISDHDRPPSSHSNTSSSSQNTDNSPTQNGAKPTPDMGAGKVKKSASNQPSGNNNQDDEKKTRSKPLDFIRKLRQTGTHSDSRDRGSSSDNGGRRKSPEPLKVDSLPQKFIAKYVGCKPCRGLWGIQHTRDPVDALVSDLRRLERGDDLPLVRLDVSIGGIGVAVHSRSRSRRPVHDLGLLPLEFISYAVQDTRYSRIFAFILVRELSSRGRSTECHAYLCDSALSARKLALSVALAFRLYERSLAGKPFRFSVDLRSAEQLAAAAEQTVNGKSSKVSAPAALIAECDA